MRRKRGESWRQQWKEEVEGVGETGEFKTGKWNQELADTVPYLAVIPFRQISFCSIFFLKKCKCYAQGGHIKDKAQKKSYLIFIINVKLS